MNKTTQSVVRVSAAVFALCFLAICVLHAFGVIQLPRFWSTPRGKATHIINDANIYEAAIDQWAKENNKTSEQPSALEERRPDSGGILTLPTIQ